MPLTGPLGRTVSNSCSNTEQSYILRANMALLHSNVGRLMRICAQTLFNDPDRRGRFTPREKAYYTSAVEHYQRSLAALGERKSFPEVWDRVTWELSGTYYTMGTLVQDYFSLKEFEAETVCCYSSLQRS